MITQCDHTVNKLGCPRFGLTALTACPFKHLDVLLKHCISNNKILESRGTMKTFHFLEAIQDFLSNPTRLPSSNINSQENKNHSHHT